MSMRILAVSTLVIASACAGSTIAPPSSDVASPSNRVPAVPVAKAPRGEWRLVDVGPDEADSEQVTIAWCAPGANRCKTKIPITTGGRFESLLQPEDGTLWAMHVHPGGDCEIVACVSDDDMHWCNGSVSSCNANNGSLVALQGNRVLYRGSGGSGISTASLFINAPVAIWSSVHNADELSPSKRYLLVGEPVGGQVFAAIGRLVVVDLLATDVDNEIARIDIPPGVDVTARWLGESLDLVWSGGHRRVPLSGAGRPSADDDSLWRPFSQ